MSDGATKKTRVDWDEPPKGATNWDRVDEMGDEEASRNAQEDPDNPSAESFPEGTLEKAFRPQWVRRRLGMSQREFAATFGFSVRSLQQWEQGRSEPGQALRAYLHVIAVDPESVRRALDKKAIA
ncbi:helix-turn-helix domain-containing protein [Candidatus Poribacteria bacterium]|nr:helix-turn-helix domain-containing protein [Candidatus Poribacteria bacterium]